MKKFEEILLGGMFRPTEQNCPTREGELIGSLDKIHDIPNPRVGMRVYVENTGKEYIIKSLKDKTIGGVNVPNAAVHEFEESDGLLKGNIEVLRQRAVDIHNSGIVGINADTISLKFASLENSVTIYDIPAATPERAGVMSAKDKRKLDALGSGATKIVWDANSNMNDYRAAGVYEIYGERTDLYDNLPILNSNPGHSIAAKLTVVDSSLQKADSSAPTEIHLTQFLMLDNRVGPSADMYMRTYTQDNGHPNNGSGNWSVWKKFQGVEEWAIVTDSDAWDFANIHGAPIAYGMKYMIDNGIYTGVYTDDNYFNGNPSFLETFTLIVINNYAVAAQDSRLKRTISQLKYAVDAITNQATVKQRTKTDGGDWTDWQDISGSGSSEVDVTDALTYYPLSTLKKNGYIKQNTVYKVRWSSGSIIPFLDTNNKIIGHILSSRNETDSYFYELYIRYYDYYGPSVFVIDAVTSWGKTFKFTLSDIGSTTERVSASADMTTL